MGLDDVVPMGAARLASNRAWWLRTLHQWHWISSAICLLGMVLFSVTGVTLNHAAGIEARPVIETLEREMPAALHERLRAAATGHLAARSDDAAESKGMAIPADVGQWLRTELAVELSGREPEWSPEEIYVPLPRPGGDAWLRIGLQDGLVEYESTDRGWISYLNDLHKGRHSGIAWRWFIDAFAVACLVFSITGLLMLKLHAASRPATWPMVGLGVVVPVLLAILFIH